MNAAWEAEFEWRAVRKEALSFAVVLLAVLLFGSLRLAFFAPASSTIRVAGLATDQSLLHPPSPEITHATDAERANARPMLAPHLEDLFVRTRQEARAGAKIVSWSEAAAMILDEDESSVIERARTLAREERIYLQLGLIVLLHTDHFPFLENRAVMIDPLGSVVWDYHKAHPTPGESSAIAAGTGSIPSVETPWGRLTTVICYDADFPAFLRGVGQASGDLLLVPALDNAVVKFTHTQIATFRAIENGTSLVRPASEGISIAVDYQGRVLGNADSFATAKSDIVAEVPTQGTRTIYARIGDIFAYLCIVSLVVLIGYALFARPHSSKPKSESGPLDT